jgi:hypothetical protein
MTEVLPTSERGQNQLERGAGKTEDRRDLWLEKQESVDCSPGSPSSFSSSESPGKASVRESGAGMQLKIAQKAQRMYHVLLAQL